MNQILDRVSWLVTVRPWVTILVLVIITVLLAAGAARRAPPPETRATLPQDSAVAEALVELGRLFGDSGEANVVTLLFRGDALTPAGLAQMDSLIGSIVADSSVEGLLVQADPVVAPSSLMKLLLQTDDLESVGQEQIDSIRGPPEIRQALAAMTGNDADGTPVAIATIRLRYTGDERIEVAERRINELAMGNEGPLEVSSVSSVVIEDAYKKATEEGMLPLIGLSFLLIAGLLLLFLRAVSDLLLTLGGLLMSMIWIVGAEGWLGPNALGVTGPPNSLTVLVPIIIISLTVDYAIQVVSHYREQRLAGEQVMVAIRAGVRNVAVPLALAAVTTVVSLLANLFSPIEIVFDFGIIAGLGVAMSLVVMLSLVPAGRAIIDRRRERRGRLPEPRPIANALPGVRRLAELLGRSVTRHPAPYLAAVVAVTVGMAFAATGLKSEFSIRDILPRGGTLLEDMNTLDAAVGGSTEVVSVLIKAEITETRTLVNMLDLANAFNDEHRRPQAAAGPIQDSYVLIAQDWTDDSGLPGDKFDPELATLFEEATAGVEFDAGLMQEFFDKLEEHGPRFARPLNQQPPGNRHRPDSIPGIHQQPRMDEANSAGHRGPLVWR